MRPDTHVRVTVAHGEVAREEVIKVHQTVQQFKATLHGWFGVPAQNMKLYYCDKVIISDSSCLYVHIIKSSGHGFDNSCNQATARPVQ